MDISDKLGSQVVENKMIKKKSVIVIYGRKENTNTRDLGQRT